MKYELYARLNGWDKDSKLKEESSDLLPFLPLFLVEQVEVSFHQPRAQIRSEYQLVKRELIKRYGLKPQDACKRFVTATFSRTGQVDGFADELRRLISAVTNIPEEARDALVLNLFLLGLPEVAAEKIILSCEREGMLELETVLDQYGFRPGCSTTDAIHVVRRKMDLFERHAAPFQSLSLDIQRAYDSITLEPGYNLLLDSGRIPPTYVRAIRNLYAPSNRRFQLNGKDAHYQRVTGVAQGGIKHGSCFQDNQSESPPLGATRNPQSQASVERVHRTLLSIL